LRGAAQHGVEALTVRLQTEFRAEPVVPLCGADATKAAITGAIRDTLVQDSNPGDVVIFYFIGHGMRKGRTAAFLTAYDTAWFTEQNKANPILLRTRFSIEDLTGAFEQLKPGVRIEAIFDTCFAGAAGLRWQRLRLATQGKSDALITFLRRAGVRNPGTLHHKIEKALRGREYVLWLSSSSDQQSHAIDVGGRLVGAFTVALDSALTSYPEDQRQRTLRTVRSKVAASRQTPNLAPSKERLRRRTIFEFGEPVHPTAASEVTQAS
jgi:uncharacterized caspase-like protein